MHAASGIHITTPSLYKSVLDLITAIFRTMIRGGRECTWCNRPVYQSQRCSVSIVGADAHVSTEMLTHTLKAVLAEDAMQVERDRSDVFSETSAYCASYGDRTAATDWSADLLILFLIVRRPSVYDYVRSELQQQRQPVLSS